MNTKISTKITLWVNRAILMLLAVLIFTFPKLLDWYQSFRPLGLHGAAAVFGGFYLCLVPVGVALWRIERLLQNILAEQIFVSGNVRLIRTIRNCCFVVAAVCGAAGCLYQPLLFLSIIMGFLTLIVSVVVNVIAAAVELREENDLTV